MGASPAGEGAVETVDALPTPTAGVRYISPQGDFYIDPLTDGFAEMSPTTQRVLIAIGTTLGSSTAYPDLGIRDPIKLTERFEAACRNSVLVALRPMVTAGEIRVDEVKVQRVGASRVYRLVTFTDLQNDTQQTVQSRIQ